MCKAIRDWSKEERTIGRKEGRKEGREEGYKQINNLGLRMRADNRINDFFRGLSNTNYLHKLLREYGLDAK